VKLMSHFLPSANVAVTVLALAVSLAVKIVRVPEFVDNAPPWAADQLALVEGLVIRVTCSQTPIVVLVLSAGTVATVAVFTSTMVTSTSFQLDH
jgi:predicted ribosomally synthesized peptide with SipW-like signal peptide